MVWKPHVTVAAVLERDGRFLLVEEMTEDGIRYNQPAGHLECGESLIEALTIVDDLVIDLVGIDDQVVLAGNLDDFLEQIDGIECTGGLLGLMMTMARVRELILARMSSRSGSQPFASSQR